MHQVLFFSIELFFSSSSETSSDGFRAAESSSQFLVILEDARLAETKIRVVRDDPSTDIHQLEFNLNKSHFQLRAGFLRRGTNVKRAGFAWNVKHAARLRFEDDFISRADLLPIRATTWPE